MPYFRFPTLGAGLTGQQTIFAAGHFHSAADEFQDSDRGPGRRTGLRNGRSIAKSVYPRLNLLFALDTPSRPAARTRTTGLR